MKPRTLIALALAALAATPAPAGILYKSVDANGTVMFSDMPPPEGARIVEQRILSETGTRSAGTPIPAGGLGEAFQMIDYDAALARANARVDFAEHAFAQARRMISSPNNGLRLIGTRMSRTDEERVEFHKRDVQLARQSLMDLLRSRQLASR